MPAPASRSLSFARTSVRVPWPMIELAVAIHATAPSRLTTTELTDWEDSGPTDPLTAPLPRSGDCGAASSRLFC